MMAHKFLEGEVVDPQAKRIAELELDVRRLTRERDDAQRDAGRAMEDANRAMSMLRHTLQPLFRALQAVFGELDAAGIADAPPAVGAAVGPSGVVDTQRWDEWKRRLGPSCAKVIDALLLGGEMTVTAIMTTAKMGKQTVYQATSKMGQVGILHRNGSKFSLKPLS